MFSYILILELPSSLLFCLTVIVEIIEETDRLQDAFTETTVCWILLVDLLKEQRSIYKLDNHL